MPAFFPLQSRGEGPGCAGGGMALGLGRARLPSPGCRQEQLAGPWCRDLVPSRRVVTSLLENLAANSCQDSWAGKKAP